MSTTTLTPATLDVSGTPRVPLSRLTLVELRKTADTRAGKWLLIITGIVVALVMTIMLLVVTIQDLSVGFGDFISSTGYSSALFLPILGALLVTSEWGQRTAMVTFTLEPNRRRVFVAKLMAASCLALAATLFGLVAGTMMNLIYGFAQGGAEWEFGFWFVAGFTLAQLIGVLAGFALGALFLNTPAAIVVFFVYSWILPAIFAVGAELMGWFDKVRPWIDFAEAQMPLFNGTSPTGSEWAHLLVTMSVWLVLPLAVGMYRVLRTEVK